MRYTTQPNQTPEPTPHGRFRFAFMIQVVHTSGSGWLSFHRWAAGGASLGLSLDIPFRRLPSQGVPPHRAGMYRSSSLRWHR